MDFGHDGGRAWPITKERGFIYALDLPEDATAMTLEQLDRLIAYYDELSTRYDEALTRLDAARDQTKAARSDSERGTLGSLREINAAHRWTEAFADYSWCRDEIEAIAAYAEPLKVDAGGSP
jgi:hypothetical protein